MTDKQMVNSIDVNECEFLWKERLPKKVCNNGNLDCDCNSNPNCYYKQLKRKEQECEEINLKNERLVAEKYTMNEEILKFRQALDEIEKYLDAQQKYFDGEDYHNLLDIINKVKGEIDEES